MSAARSSPNHTTPFRSGQLTNVFPLLTDRSNRPYLGAMKRNIWLLAGVIALYLFMSLILYGVYGPSYGLFEGVDRWVPDGTGGWEARGTPTDPMPDVPSEVVPYAVQYLPILVPGLFLLLFLFTPLKRLVESPKPTESDSDEEESGNDDRYPLPDEEPPDDTK